MTAPRPVTADPRCAAARRDLVAVLRDGHGVTVIATERGQPVRPLAIGIHGVLAELRREGVAAAELRHWLCRYVRSVAYVLAVSRDGSIRHGIDGAPVEAVSDQHREHARKEHKRAVERARATKLAAAAKAAPESPAPEPKPVLKLAPPKPAPAPAAAPAPPPARARLPRPGARLLSHEEAERRLLAARAARADRRPAKPLEPSG